MGLFQDVKNNFRGKAGEVRIESKLGFINFFGYKGKSLHNIYIPRPDGSTTEIDILYITSKGLFVIESKNYAGYIFGNDRNTYWTSTLYAGKTWYGKKKVEKHQFYNPVKQNYAHIKSLESYIGKVQTFSIIAFGNNCELMEITVSYPNVYVCQTNELNGIVKDIWKSTADVLTEDDIEDLYSKLIKLTNVDRQKKVEHIQEIQNGSTTEICPWCGENLVLRTAKKGVYAGNQFYGCSNYPKCKYTRNI